MADTTTPVLGLVRQTIGGNRNTWGGILNACMDLIEGAFYGMTSKVVSGGSYSLTDSERRKRILVFTGTLSDHQIIVIPNLVGRWTVRNATTGAFNLSFKTASGSAVVVPQGGHCNVWCDGNDVVYAELSTRLRDVQMLAPAGTDEAPDYSFASEINSGLRRVSLGLLAIIIGGVRVVTIAGTALRVAISDTGVAVTGNLAVSGTFTVGGQTPTPVGAGTDYDGIYEPNGWKFRNGQALSRTTYSLLFEVLTVTATATRNASNTLTDVSKDFTGLGLESAALEGTGIPSGATITSVTSTTIVMSHAATGTGSITIRIGPHGLGDGSTTFTVPNDKDRVNPGRGNMGGTSANRLTNQSGGIEGDRLGATGGSETSVILQANLPNLTIETAIAAGQGGHSHTVSNTYVSGGGLTNGTGAVFYSVGTQTTSTATLPAMTGTTPLGGSDTPVNIVMPSRITNKIIFTGVYT